MLLGALLWVFLQFAKTETKIVGKITLLIVGIISTGVCLYLVVFWPDIVKRYGIPLPHEYILGGILVLVLLYVGKRLVGWAFPIIVVCFLAYALFGPYMPGILSHKGVTVERLLSSIYLTTQGIWGTVMHVAATTIIQFVIFGSFLRLWGAGDFFMNLTSAMVGSVRGGPAKMAVVSSGLTGMISGVATANVATTGSITIPLMKRTGYPPAFAGAVEAAASTGGQILPPVMGASVFVMAETLGVPIWEVMKAALIPALLFYFGVFMAVDFQAAKLNLRGVNKEELPRLKDTLKNGWLYFVPIIVLVIAVYLQYSPGRAAFLSIVALLIVGLFIRDAKPSLKKFLEALKSGAEDTVLITVACALAGIVVGVLNMTGLGVTFGNYLVAMSGGSLVLLLLFTMVGCILLGMGLPTIAAYIIVSLTIAPVLISTHDVWAMAAHMFVFFFAIMSVITPPVAVASYVAAGIAQSDPFKTGWQAFFIVLPTFIIPFIFVYASELLLHGSWPTILWRIALTVVSVYGMVAAIQGYHRSNLSIFFRFLFMVASLLLIIPHFVTDVLGIVCFVLVVFLEQVKNWRTRHQQHEGEIIG